MRQPDGHPTTGLYQRRRIICGTPPASRASSYHGRLMQTSVCPMGVISVTLLYDLSTRANDLIVFIIGLSSSQLLDGTRASLVRPLIMLAVGSGECSGYRIPRLQTARWRSF
uniref:Uncharacterized protein n=1 Tax=Plectus sambesii TaxID=2011161 RepID=A0A914XN79_9BILA